MTRDSSNNRQTARTHHTARSPAFFSQTSQFPCNLLPNPVLYHSHRRRRRRAAPVAQLWLSHLLPISSSSAPADALVQAEEDREHACETRVSQTRAKINLQLMMTCEALAGGSAGAGEEASRPRSSEAGATRAEAGAETGRALTVLVDAVLADDLAEEGRCCCCCCCCWLSERLALRERSDALCCSR